MSRRVSFSLAARRDATVTRGTAAKTRNLASTGWPSKRSLGSRRVMNTSARKLSASAEGGNLNTISIAGLRPLLCGYPQTARPRSGCSTRTAGSPTRHPERTRRAHRRRARRCTVGPASAPPLRRPPLPHAGPRSRASRSRHDFDHVVSHCRAPLTNGSHYQHRRWRAAFFAGQMSIPWPFQRQSSGLRAFDIMSADTWA